MTLQDVIARVNAIDTALAEVKKDLINLASAGGTVTVPVAPVVSKYEMNGNHMLTHVRAFGTAYCDPVVGPDCPYTKVCPATGHVLSLARPDLGENFMGYVQRVADQATNGNGDRYAGTIGTLLLGTGTFFQMSSHKPLQQDGSNWPEAADCFYNIRAYMTPEERKKDDDNKAGWDQWAIDMQNNATNHPPSSLPPDETPL